MPGDVIPAIAVVDRSFRSEGGRVMRDIRTIGFYAILVIGIVAGIYHMTSGRYGNGALAFSAVLLGMALICFLLFRYFKRVGWL
jgi:hypothetical protein